MDNKKNLMTRVKLFVILHNEKLLRVIKITPEVWDFIQEFILPLF